jgi:hypothetical protein
MADRPALSDEEYEVTARMIMAGAAALPDWVEEEAEKRGESLSHLVAKVHLEMSRNRARAPEHLPAS